MLPTVQRYGMGTLVYSPLSGGWLTGRWRKGAPGTPTSAARPGARFDMSTPANQRKLDVVEELALLAEKSGMTMIELALRRGRTDAAGPPAVDTRTITSSTRNAARLRQEEFDE